MKRRDFIKMTLTSTGGLLFFPNVLKAALFASTAKSHDDNNILVFIQLNGGNDGLNTFIPYTDPIYYLLRPTIGIPKENIINSSNGMGFHPMLKGLAEISQEGQLSIIQNVGYPNPNRSHFRSQEIWQTASDSNEFLIYGWLGRFLASQYKDENIAAVNLDSIDNLALKSLQINSITVKDFNLLKTKNSNETTLKLSDNPALDFVRKVAYASVEGAEEIQKALNKAPKQNEMYANNPLSRNLEWISKLIKGGLSSNIYYTTLGGFDTHNNQLQVQQRQLRTVDEAVYSFYKDLKSNSLLNRVTLVIFSEFGRRVKENGSGTDHGTAGPMFVIGGSNKGKIIGTNPDLQKLDKGDLIYKIDYRAVYAALLQQKFQFDPKKIGIKQSPLQDLF